MAASDGEAAGQRAFERLLDELRPKLHRYCARMTGSAFDGEDVLQEALGKAILAFPKAPPPADLEAWLFRIAHNAAIDFLRRRRRQAELFGEDGADLADPSPTPEDRALASASLHAFMTLTVAQRSSVILMDVLGYSLQEIGRILHQTTPATKAALHRGRARLREMAGAFGERPVPPLGVEERGLLERYVDRFNARDFDAVRDMLATEVLLDMVGKARLAGVEQVAAVYLGNYGKIVDWSFSLGMVDGRPAVLVRDPADPGGAAAYFVQLEWKDSRLVRIRDFRYARYVTDGAAVAPG